MRVALFSTKPYDQTSFQAANAARRHELVFFEPHLNLSTAALAAGFPAICPFVNDQLDRPVLEALARQGTRLIALRSAGFNHVDLIAARDLRLTVARVPAYSPHAVAEHTVALMLSLNRKIHRAYARVREGNFALEGLLGFDLNGRTVGIIGTGKIGAVVARIMNGFGCRLLAYDPSPDEACRGLGVRYTSLTDLYEQSHIITLHCPLTPKTHHLIDATALERMRSGVMLINTGRGALIDTQAVIAALKSGKIGALGLDVYEEEADLFFEDLSNRVIQDDFFSRLLTFPNVLITGHQGFFTQEAMARIAETTLRNLSDFEQGRALINEVRAEQVLR
ncbi:MAG: 2-hydroxyacid dehydrogenase [Candidatus Manganitrophaceae bacterium]|nr:MAG: 2-hydroxyacid dehydrogenase [Candidatus Manganitrophaceae bacterium]